MTKLATKVNHISSADGEVIIDATSRTTEELLSLASMSGTTGGRMVVVNISGLDKDLLVRMAYAGKGNMLFDLR